MNNINVILDKYKNEDGYISNLRALYYELIKIISKDETLSMIEKIIEDNKSIYNAKKLANKHLEEIHNKRRTIEIITYKKVEEECIKKSNEYEKIDIEAFYGSYLDFMLMNIENDLFLEFLPNTSSVDNIKEIDMLLVICVNRINELKALLADDNDVSLISDLSQLTTIYSKVLEYKNSLLFSEKTQQSFKNEIIYYMNGDNPYVYTDIKDNPELYNPVYELIMSIVNGNFKKIKYFSNNEKTKGLLEVRDTFNRVRVLFEALGNRKYALIGVITNKTSSNSIYKERLVTRYQNYKNDKKNLLLEENYGLLIKIKGDNNE